MINVSIVNQSTTYPDAKLPALANALQIQVNRDVFPAWGVKAQMFWTPTGSNPTADHWVIAILDNADQAGALGYHDVTPAGLPMGKVFAVTAKADGVSVESVASHETLEQLIDPGINLVAEFDDASGNPAIFYAYEISDSPENTSYNIDVPANFTGGPATVEVSNFVFPSWFESFRTTGPFDQLGLIKAPFELLPGGYIGFLDLANLSAGWQQKTARGIRTAREKLSARPRMGSRRMRRMLPRKDWIVSTYSPGTHTPLQAEAA